MTVGVDLATEVRVIGSHLLELLARPSEPSPETLEVCLRLFSTVGEPTLTRWIECERDGYGGSGAVSIKEVLGVPDDSPLASRVRTYRQYVGRVRTASQGPAQRQMQLPYFFGESLEALRHLRANADALTVDFIEVELPTGSSADPIAAPAGVASRTLEFPRYIFYRILSGLAVEVEMTVRGIMLRFAEV